jgi:hypothetical protein
MQDVTPRLAALAAAVALAAAGCGSGTSGEEDELQGKPIAAASVVQQFRSGPGRPLLRSAPGGDAAWDQLSLGLDVSPKLQRRFGTFSIYVVKPGHAAALESLLADKETKKPLERGAGGIYWEFDALAGSYVAYKRYGPNVVLAWWNEKRAPGTDPRWEELDRLLSGLGAA